MLKKLLPLFLLLGIASPLRAQFIGYTSPQTITTTPFNAVTCTGSNQTATVPNIGQSVHIVVAQAGSVKSMLLWIQGSNDGTNFFDISEQVTSQGVTQAAVQGNGYFAVVRVIVNCTSGGSITASYTGQSVTAGQPFGNFFSAQYTKNIVQAQPANTSFTGQIFRTPFANASGLIYAQMTGGTTTAGNVQVVCSQNATLSPSFTTANPILGANTTLQNFIVPPTGCPYMEVIYNSSGAPTSVITIDYVFAPLGAYPGLFQFYSPDQLGANAITLPASSTTALTATIDLRAVRQATLWSNCGQIYNLNITFLAEDGLTTLLTQSSVVTNVPASTFSSFQWGSESNPIAMGGTLGTFTFRQPQRAMRFSWTNTTATPSTCTARLFVAY